MQLITFSNSLWLISIEIAWTKSYSFYKEFYFRTTRYKNINPATSFVLLRDFYELKFGRRNNYFLSVFFNHVSIMHETNGCCSSITNILISS